MQNQPGSRSGEQDRTERVHDRQAARTREDAFRGGESPRRRLLEWLRQPWKPAAGRLFPGPKEPDQE